MFIQDKNISFLYIVAGIIFLTLSFEAFRYKKLLDKNNIKLIQFYLDTKFLHRSLVESLNTVDSSYFCKCLISNIKEYYNLEDIFIIDSIEIAYEEKNPLFRNAVLSYLKNNWNNIKYKIDDCKLLHINFLIESKLYEIYITSIISSNEGSGLIVCVESTPSLLSDNEKITLENVINLLKNRLFYS